MKYIRLIKEFKNNNLIDSKMNELKDLISNVSNGQELIYEWENKFDHHLLINFIIGSDSIQYELDIDDLIVRKTLNNEIEFESDISGLEEGLELIESDIIKTLNL